MMTNEIGAASGKISSSSSTPVSNATPSTSSSPSQKTTMKMQPDVANAFSSATAAANAIVASASSASKVASVSNVPSSSSSRVTSSIPTNLNLNLNLIETLANLGYVVNIPPIPPTTPKRMMPWRWLTRMFFPWTHNQNQNQNQKQNQKQCTTVNVTNNGTKLSSISLSESTLNPYKSDNSTMYHCLLAQRKHSIMYAVMLSSRRIVFAPISRVLRMQKRICCMPFPDTKSARTKIRSDMRNNIDKSDFLCSVMRTRLDCWGNMHDNEERTALELMIKAIMLFLDACTEYCTDELVGNGIVLSSMYETFEYFSIFHGIPKIIQYVSHNKFNDIIASLEINVNNLNWRVHKKEGGGQQQYASITTRPECELCTPDHKLLHDIKKSLGVWHRGRDTVIELYP